MMRASEGTLLALTGGLRLKTRVQHPKVIERTDRGGAYWYFRYWRDEIQPDGSVKTVRKFQRLGPSRGENKLTKKQAEIERDKILASLNKATVEEKIVEEGLILFGAMAEKYIHSYVDATAAGRSLLSISTRIKYHNQLNNHILPRWKDVRLCDIRPDEVQRWLFETCTSWHAMNDLRGIMSAVFTKAQEWGYWPESRRNPISRVKIGEKWNVNPERILTWDETARVLSRIKEPNRLVIETAIATGARISELLGLQWQHVDLEQGTIRIEQRYYRGDIDQPKTKRSRRLLTLGYLVERFADKKRTENPKPADWVFGRNDGSGLPIWDSAVRQCLKRAARAEGCDFKGLGPHSFRRANITWRQEVGASAIEAAKIAGHSSVRMTEHYTKIQIQRQEELTKAIQERLAAAAKGSPQDHEEPPAPPKAPPNPPPPSSAPEAPPSLADVPMATQVVQ